MKMFDPNEEEIAERIGNSGEEERDLGERDNLSLGTYRICFYNLDNLFSRLVDLNVRVNSVDWFEYKEHLPEDTLEDLDKSRIVESLDRLLGSLDHVKLQATRSRLSLTVDSLRAEASVSYVDHMALLSCLLIIGSGLMQVYFVRKLFETPNVRGTTNKA
ncbi:transmembrane emp24 domain-containing protein 6-like [Branchiostoma floridae]|uniref:Transmembrane emp24 domain-containing protein 6-like n=1 Tax=Branchiostoma floridae TaxID=7739 RepID=A0A9J7N220_BRAFL|nr:transmembrane emp24 domain-containing protein 6-like [Branchiostoma floridae]